MASARPRVLDLTRRSTGPEVDLAWSLAAELLISLTTYASPETVHTLDVGQAWFDEVRTAASPGLLELLGLIGTANWGGLLGEALAGPPRDIDGFLHRVDEMPPEQVWLRVIGAHDDPDLASRLDQATLDLAVEGDPGARDEIRRLLVDQPKREPPLNDELLKMDSREAGRLLTETLRQWRQDVLARTESEVGRALERDFAAKRALARRLAPEELVEQATHGVELTPYARRYQRVMLVPQVAMRPWNVMSAHEQTLMICYPVSDENLVPESEALPVSVLRVHKALADEKRLRLLRRLARSSASLQELSEEVGLAKSTTHHHMVILRSAGLIRTTLDEEAHYSLRPEALAEIEGALHTFLKGGES